MSCGHGKLYRCGVQRGRLRLVLRRSGGACAGARAGGAGRLLAERLILRMRLPLASAFLLAQVDDVDRYVVRRVELVAAGVEELLRALGRDMSCCTMRCTQNCATVSEGRARRWLIR